jgi:diacylglycerol kinase
MFKKRMASFGFAFKGLATLIRTQPNARIHVLATVIVVIAGCYFPLQPSEWLWLIGAMAGVWITEAINTALEFLTDLVSPDYHPLAGHAKDVAAAAVLLAAITAVLIGLIIFVPHISAVQ